MERKKLFTTRRKLFSSLSEQAEGGQVLRDLICKDCGQIVKTAASPTTVYCPNCGGNRFDIKLFQSKVVNEAPIEKAGEEKNFSRLSLFENPISAYESNLKTFSGKTIDNEEFEKTFSEKAEEMIEKGYAEVSESGVSISRDAFELERLFSKLTISVTKTLELDPDIMKGEMNKEEVIEDLRDNDKLPEKSIVILRKAHGLNPISRNFSEESEDIQWVKDSSIISDLELEYNNKSFGIEQFVSILRSRYDDAPENIIDILVNEGVLQINGNQVTIHK